MRTHSLWVGTLLLIGCTRAESATPERSAMPGDAIADGGANGAYARSSGRIPGDASVGAQSTTVVVGDASSPESATSHAAINAGPSPPPALPTTPPATTQCRDDAECVTVRHCHEFAALNRAWSTAHPPREDLGTICGGVDDWAWTGPPAACRAHQCVLEYPPVELTCQSDSDCVVLPQLRADAVPGSCRLACDAFVFANRTWSYRAARVPVGACAPECGRNAPLPRCAQGRCAPEISRLFRVRESPLDGAPERFPTVDGTLSPADVRSVVERDWPAIRRCEQRVIAHASIAIPATVRVVIDARGAVVDADATALATDTIATHGTTYGYPAFREIASCLTAAARHWRFPRPDGGRSVRATIPFFVDVVQ